MLKIDGNHYFPVILYDSRFWGGLITWIKEQMLATEKISPEDTSLLILCDDPQEICKIVTEAYQESCRQEHATLAARWEQSIR